jgi:hypothetical protein
VVDNQYVLVLWVARVVLRVNQLDVVHSHSVRDFVIDKKVAAKKKLV